MKKSVLCLLIALFTFGTSFSLILPVYAAENDFTFTVGSNGATVTDYRGTDLNVVIPAEYAGTTLTEIGRSAFDTYGTGKPKITSVVIPNNVKVIQTYGFRYTSLTSIDLPDSLLTIGSSAFENNLLTTVVFPDSVTMIGNYSFYMNNLTSIKLSENLKTINGGAFDTNHITKLVIPASVTNVASSSFYNNNLTSITVLGDATTFGTGVFAGNPGNLKIFGIANSPVAVYASSNGHTFVDGTALFQAVSSAKSLLKSYLVGTSVGQVPANAHNDLSADYDAAMLFIDGIGNATIDSDLANAATPLTSSIAAFNAQIVQAGNPAALAAAITAAQQALTDHPQGTDVGQTSAGTRTALETAMDTAQQILDNAGNYTQDQLDTAVNQLNSAVQVFNAAVIQAGIPTALGAAITAAQQALTDHPQGMDVGQTSAGNRAALQTAIDAAQAIADDAENQSQTRLDEAIVSLNDAMAVFEAAWVGMVLTASANDLYGTSDTLRFTVFYGYEVTVIGTPVVPVMVGDNSVTQTVYAPYMGTRGEAVTKLTFEFEVPAGLADNDGIQVAASLELPNGASIVRTFSGSPASLTYIAPDANGIRIVAIPPEVSLTVAPNESERKAISVIASVYGGAAGNALTQLRWLPGSLSGVDFAGGTKGTDILATPQFTITANGDYTVYAQDEAGNEAVKTITVTGISIPSSSDNGNRPVISGTTVKLNLNGGITTLVDPSDIKQVKRSDGTVIERVILPERTREQVLELLKDAMEPFVSITIGNREQAVQAQFQADWIADMVKASPNTIVEVRLNDSSYQLRLSAIDLIGLAERLNAELSDLTVSIVQVQAGEHIRQEIDRIGVSQGFTVFTDVIDYKVTAEAYGQTLEVHDFGGAYSIRTIKLDRENTNRNLVAVQYIPENGTVIFVPAKMETGPDGTNEAILNVPHNSLYTVVNVQARTFADLIGHWAKADVEHLASKLLVNGVAADRFESEGTITRAEFSALLVRGLGLSVKESEGGDRFADVPASAWYASAVNVAVASGLVSGIDAGRFAPNDPITREQMAVVIVGALTFTSHGTGSDGQEGGHLDAFTDRDSISSWAQAAVVRASEDGIMKGMEDGRFAPREYVTRAQAAVILKRFLQYVHFID